MPATWFIYYAPTFSGSVVTVLEDGTEQVDEIKAAPGRLVEGEVQQAFVRGFRVAHYDLAGGVAVVYTPGPVRLDGWEAKSRDDVAADYGEDVAAKIMGGS